MVKLNCDLFSTFVQYQLDVGGVPCNSTTVAGAGSN